MKCSKVLPRRRLGAILVVSATLLTSLFAQSASAACAAMPTESSCFLGMDAEKANRDDQVKADGLFVEMTTDKSDVVVEDASGNYSAAVRKPANGDIIGFNVRGAQLIDDEPGPAATEEFVAVGYTAGCGAPPTGRPAQEGCTTSLSAPESPIYKKWYMDGMTCINIFGVCTYFVSLYEAISAGDTHTYQVHRNRLDVGLRYRAYFDGKYRGLAPAMLMQTSEVSIISEKDSAWDGDEMTGRLGRWWLIRTSMVQSAFRKISYHVFGSASTYPPGTATYINPVSLSPFNTFASIPSRAENCKVIGISNTVFRNEGTC